ncbi:MAG: glycosyltransferase family 4 protein [Planctomycetes bacterium]|nr:glycosyltransferase family 4 protein [Planctomycetota bacterium]
MAKKIVHIITRMILGGAQENTLLSCEGLNRSPEWDVTLLTGPAIGPEGELIRRARKSGIRTVVIPEMRRAISPWRDSVSLGKILEYLRVKEPDIVHTHSSKAGVLGRLAAHFARVPVVIHTIHGLPFHPYENVFSNAVYIAAEKLGAACCGRIACVADAMAEQALAAGVGSESQFTTIHSGMEVDAFLEAGSRRHTIRERYGFTEDDVVIGKIARLFHLKGHEYVLQAAPEIVHECPEAKFMFVGDGILRSHLESMARDLGVADRVVFTGLVDSAEIPDMISAMDMLIHASLREGLPRAVVQALLEARPVVCYDVDGAPEVVIDGETGRLVPPESVQELAEAVTELIKNPEKARTMGQNARGRFADQFRAETMVHELEKLYRNELSRAGDFA